MKKFGLLSKLGMGALIASATAFGIATLSADSAEAFPFPPGPECGPTRLWWCELPGCPDCYVTQFEGTVCEKGTYEKKTGRVCHPEGE